jgi:hypothetical protein
MIGVAFILSKLGSKDERSHLGQRSGEGSVRRGGSGGEGCFGCSFGGMNVVEGIS